MGPLPSVNNIKRNPTGMFIPLTIEAFFQLKHLFSDDARFFRTVIKPGSPDPDYFSKYLSLEEFT